MTDSSAEYEVAAVMAGTRSMSGGSKRYLVESSCSSNIRLIIP